MKWLPVTLACFGFVLSACHKNQNNTWAVYRGDAASSGYSSLDQINAANVKDLKVAWTWHTMDAREGNRSTIQCNPIVADGVMYVTTPLLKLAALDPETGKELWKFDPFQGSEASGVNRGVTWFADGDDKRIFFSAGSYVYAINAKDGTIITTFGENGKVDLRKGLGRDFETLAVSSTTPGIIFKNLLIQGSSVGEGYDAAPGFVRAYDVFTGKIAWTFHTIPQPGEFGYETWEENAYKQVGGANAWAGMSLDEDRGLVFIPTGSPAFDFYGGNRKGENLFGNCLLALDASTGKRKWHQQLVHHDLWDYDLPAPPTLVTVLKDGKNIDAVAQVSKMGLLFIFERETGKPVFPIEERPVIASGLQGEKNWPTQPFPIKPPPFSRQRFTVDSVTNISNDAHDAVMAKIKNGRMGAIYTPPDTESVVQFPGTRGGAEWGGASFDPESHLLYVNANEVPMFIKMKKLTSAGALSLFASGERLFTVNNCTSCHGGDRQGIGTFPSLKNISKKLSREQVRMLLTTGKGQMPAFPNIKGPSKDALIAFLFDDHSSQKKESHERVPDSISDRYVHDGWNVLTDANGYPGVKPPWGTLNAIDLDKGEIRWKVPFGEFAELTNQGIPLTGTPNLGGGVATAGGLYFIAATKDEKFRAYDKSTGKIIWEYKLPAGGYATPAVYESNGKQYIVIAAGGGGKVGSASGDSYVAFALP